MLHYLRVGLRLTITQSHTHTMQQTRTHKAVTRRVEAKKLLSRRRQLQYSLTTCDSIKQRETYHFFLNSSKFGIRIRIAIISQYLERNTPIFSAQKRYHKGNLIVIAGDCM